MDPVSGDYNPHSLETEVLSLWKGRRLPPAGGTLGPPRGSTVRQVIGGWTQGDFPSLVAQRAVAADADARYLALVGRRAVGTLRQEAGPGHDAPSTVRALLTALGIWTGGIGESPWDPEDRTVGVQAMIARLAVKGILVTRDESFRACPSCGTPRGPERIVYEEQDGDTYLVRFPVRVGDWTVNALVWVDAPWKLLGANALLVNPDLRYVVAGYRRREDRELVLTSAASLARLRNWIPEANFEVVEERPGKAFQGTAYTYPLRHEFPMGGDLTPPAGTIIAAADVGESGTGIVPLVPGHGPTDAQIAARIGVAGWPLLTPKGILDVTLMHKYAGLDLETANEFVLRDLSEAGALLARLRVRRGVPHCAICGTPLLWAPGRAWCLEPSRLPPEVRARFSRLLPQEVLPAQTEVAPWPFSEASPSDDPSAISLLECPRCERLDGPAGPKPCPCGGQRTIVRRRLLLSSAAAMAAWARFDPFPEGDSVHLYVGQRRRVPALVNQLAALAAIEGAVPEVALTVVPTLAAAEAPELIATYGADAVRAALLRGGLSESTGGHFADGCRREADRIRRWWLLSREVVSRCDGLQLASFARPISGFLGELEVEDRALLARWERARVLALSQYDQWAAGLAHRGVVRFLDNDLVEYREMVQSRLALTGTPPTKQSALRTLAHVLRGLSEVLAPIVPFTAEAVHRSLSPERMSLFEQPMAGPDRALMNDELVASWDRWRTVLRSVERFRRTLGVSSSTELPSVVLVVPADDVGDHFRAEKETLARLARVQRVDVGSPREPWTGRQRVLRPVESEIQKAYPTEASQIIHLLQRMAPRRWDTSAAPEDLDVVINGLPRRVFPSMIGFSNTLPERVVPFPWPLGEMYVELPSGAEVARPPAPPLSSDAFWLVRRVGRRLRASPPVAGQRPRIAIATAKDPLASELRGLAEPIARYLGLAELRVVEKSEEAVPPNALTGRTRTGDRWWVHVPELPRRPPREKRPCAGDRLQRVPSSLPSEEAEEVDYSDEKLVAHEEVVRALGQQLDDLIGIPLLGPAKVAVAWDRGLHSVGDLRSIPYETVSTWPGFGGPVAAVVVAKLGGTVPAAEHRRIRRGPPTTRPTQGPPPPASLPPTLRGPAAAPPAERPLAAIEPPSPPTSPPSQAPGAEREEPAPSTTAGSAGPTVPGGAESELQKPSVSLEPAGAFPEPPEPPIESAEPEPASPPAGVAMPEEPEPPAEGPTLSSPPELEEPPEAEPPEAAETLPEPEAPPEPETPAAAAISLGAEALPEPETSRGAEAPAEVEPPSAPEVPAEVEIPPEAEAPPEPETPQEPQPPAVGQVPPLATGASPEPVGLAVEASRAAEPAVPVVPVIVSEVVPPPPTEPAKTLETVAPLPSTEPPTPEVRPTASLPPELREEVEPPLPSPPSGVELAIGDSLVAALGGFLDSTAAGHHGVCVVRESPERIRARVGSRPIEVFWLTNIGRGPSLRPSDLEGVWSFLGRKLIEEHVTAFFLEGIEYLVRLHGAEAVLTGLVQFDRSARENDARIWVCLAPSLMKPSDLERFRSTFGGEPGPR